MNRFLSCDCLPERTRWSHLASLRTGSQRGRKKIRQAKRESERRDSASEASGTRTPSSPDRSRLVSLALDYTRLSRLLNLSSYNTNNQ